MPMTGERVVTITPPSADDAAPRHSEEALALEFARRHGHELRYVAAWNKWFAWDGKRWQLDDTRKVFSLARAICREASFTVNNRQAEAKKLASAKTRAAVVSLAGEDRHIAATVDQWDADPWLLNTPGGVVDLRDGTICTHRPEDYMTKITAVAPAGECPKWRAFIKKVTNDDEKFATFLQRVCGYALTGTTVEQALFFLFGSGQNGKSVFITVVSSVLNDYHRAAPIDVFTESNNERHPTELAMLMGARLVTAVEPGVGRRWNETRIKQMTGGDKISARFMRQDFFEYVPQFKLAFAGNNKPGLRSVNKAIRRRVNILPFVVTIPDEDVIKDFAEIVVAEEGPGILQWMIDGCLAWKSDGLARPKIVVTATEDYLANEDVISVWLDERCVRDPQAATKTSDLYDDWKAWAQIRNEFVGSQTAFTPRLESLGFEVKHGRNANNCIGLKLLASFPGGPLLAPLSAPTEREA